MSAPVLEGGQDDDDILGFPGDGFVDKTDTTPGVLGEQDEEGDDSRRNEGSARKWRKSVVVAPDGHVTARIKQLKQKITGSNREDNEWTKMLRSKLDQETVDNRLTGDRTFKVNQQWVDPAPTVTKGETPKWSWFGVLFLLSPFGILSDKKKVSNCMGVCIHERMPPSVREKRKRLEHNHGSPDQRSWY
jgi:hypothetical protein